MFYRDLLQEGRGHPKLLCSLLHLLLVDEGVERPGCPLVEEHDPNRLQLLGL